MRPYLAILKDSIREAIASRVLLVTLIGIVVVLLLLAPFGISTELSTRLRRSELAYPERFAQQIVAGEEQTDTVGAHIWSLLTEAQKKELKEGVEPTERDAEVSGRERRRKLSRLIEDLNELMKEPEFYNKAAWSDVKLSKATADLANRADLSEDETERRNLLLLADGFPRSINIVESQAISLNYGTGVVAGPLPLTPSQFKRIFDRVVKQVVAVFLGFFGVFGCVVVTAGIVPRTFEPGEIALLLSKPIRRSWLFVIKFFGGCVFTLFYATVLVIGIWLLLGLRFDAWQNQLLWCIPIYVFLFAIYYSVSAVAGAIWRNAIVSVVLVILFWLGLTVVSTTRQSLQTQLERQTGIKEIVDVGNQLFAIDGRQQTVRWDSDEQEWEEVFSAPPNAMDQFARMFLASGIRFLPCYDPTEERILALEYAQSSFGGLGAPQLVMSSADDGWERIPLGRTPEFVPAVHVANDGRIVLPGRMGIYEYVGQSEKARKRSDVLGNLTSGFFGGAGKAFPKISPTDYPDLGTNFATAMNPTNGDLLLFGDGQLAYLTVDEPGQYRVAALRQIDTEKTGVVGIAGQHGILALGDGQVQVVQLDSLKTTQSLQLPEGVLPRTCAASPSGQLAVLTHAETVMLWDPADQTLKDSTPANSPVCSAVAFDADGNLLVANGRLTVRRFDVQDLNGAAVESWSEEGHWVYQLYDLVINPLWKVLPKPSQLDSFVSYVLSGERSVLVNDRDGPPGFINAESLQQERDVFDPYQVLRDNVAFVVVMLLIGCVVVSRRDF